jgi:Flp pilus assembly protein TadG
MKHSRAKRQKGHAMLELALSAGVMMTCLAGTFQFGYTFYVYNQLVTAVGNGARYAAQRTYRAASPADIERGNAAIRNMVVYGDAQPSSEATPVIPGLKPEQVTVEWIGKEGSAPVAVDVSVHDYTVDAIFRAFTFDRKPLVEFPYIGRYAPGENER